MKLKGLVWFFAIALIIVSLWELSYTWAVHSFENKQQAAAERYIKTAAPGLKGDEKRVAVEKRKLQLLDSLRDKQAYPIVGTSYQDCKKNELNLGLDLQGGINVTMDVSLEGLIKSLSFLPMPTKCRIPMPAWPGFLPVPVKTLKQPTATAK
jgi:SecD/SecF fusion protein